MNKFLLAMVVFVMLSCNNVAKVEIKTDSLARKIDSSEILDSIRSKGDRLWDSTKSKGGKILDKVEEKFNDLKKKDSSK